MARRTLGDVRVIVTGASSGIGRAVALELARRGAKLIVTARREDRLVTLVESITSMGGEAFFVVGDITEASVRQACIDEAVTRFGGLDCLLNNAGVGALGIFADASSDRLRKIMEVNFFAPVEFIRQALPTLRGGNRPIIVQMNSVLGHRAMPGKSEYCASKFAIHGFSDALRAELADEGIDVLLVSPSTTDSEFFASAIDKEKKPRSPGSPKPKESSWKMSPEKVAQITVRAMANGRHEVLLSVGGKALVWLDRLLPPVADWIAMRFGMKRADS